MSRAAALLLATVLVACGECADERGAAAVAEQEPSAPSPRTLFPLGAGDRWRVEAGEDGTPHNQGITGVDDSGVAVMHGTAHALVERYRASDEAVSLVDPSGRELIPLLRAPLETGRRWEYELAEDDGAVPCTAEVRDTAATAQVGGLEVDGCVIVRRRCEHPEGLPFTEPTVHTADETYCPSLGRLVTQDRFRPAPPVKLMPAERTRRVVGYRVAGAPRWPAPETFDCRSFILLPSDAQAACGTSVQPVEPVAGESGSDRCTYRFRSPEGEIEVSAERHPSEPSGEELDGALQLPAGAVAQTHEGARFGTVDAQVRFALAEGRVVVTGRAPAAACPEQSAMRLVPLLRSLLR